MAPLTGCPQCGAALRAGHFDATFRSAVGVNKVVRDIAGAYCANDEFLAFGAEDLANRGLTGLTVISAVLAPNRRSN